MLKHPVKSNRNNRISPFSLKSTSLLSSSVKAPPAALESANLWISFLTPPFALPHVQLRSLQVHLVNISPVHLCCFISPVTYALLITQVNQEAQRKQTVCSMQFFTGLSYQSSFKYVKQIINKILNFNSLIIHQLPMYLLLSESIFFISLSLSSS